MVTISKKYILVKSIKMFAFCSTYSKFQETYSKLEDLGHLGVKDFLEVFIMNN